MSILLSDPSRARVDSPPQFAAFIAALDGGAQDVLALAAKPLIFSRHHYLEYDGDTRERADLKLIFEGITNRPPVDWSDKESELVFVLYLLELSKIGLEQLDTRLTVDATREVFADRLRLYLDIVPGSLDQKLEASLTEQARAIVALRAEAERTHYRCSLIDGQRWYRRELLFPRSDVDPDAVPSALVSRMAQAWPGLRWAGSSREFFQQAVDRCLAVQGTSHPVLEMIADQAVLDGDLAVDHATITCPIGVLLDEPEQLGEDSHFFKFTALRPGLDLSVYQEQIGHASDDRLKLIIRNRMQHLKHKASKNFYGSGCLRGELTEKACDHMIFFHEDSHHKGHRQSGVVTGGRAAYGLEFTRQGRSYSIPPVLADFRVVRMDHGETVRFTVEGMKRLTAYTFWIRAALERTFAACAVVAS